ncbi:MAG TPA: hypothetical protein VE398_09100, partial [Acidobacteriota bacterium]|nr:hypothetical protein [Acidobacteriota bacterium]
LETPERQTEAFRQIAACLRPGGWYVAIENFREGNDAMNSARQRFNLPEIPVRWHNLYFEEKRFVDHTTAWFDLVRFEDFASSYYLATRVLYSAWCKERGETPDYTHDLHRLATDLPACGQYSPIRMVVLRRKLANA